MTHSDTRVASARLSSARVASAWVSSARVAGLFLLALAVSACSGTTGPRGPSAANGASSELGTDATAFAPATSTRAPSDPDGVLVALKGGLIGPSLGKTLGAEDQLRALAAEYRALENTPAGESVIWQGAKGEIFGEVAAAQPYRVGSQNCRQYAHSVTIDSKIETITGAACRNPNGSWTPLN